MDRDIAQRLIDLYNEHYQKIFMAAQRKGRDVVLRRDISAFFRGSIGFAELFHELAFGDDGKLPAERVLQNLAGIQASQKLELLSQGLSELLDFMLFTAMESMSHWEEQVFEQRVQVILAEAARTEDRARGDQPAGDAPVDVMDLRDPMPSLTPVMRPEDVIGYLKIPPLGNDELTPSGGRTSVTFIPYLPDDQVYEFSTAIRAARSDATLALERAEQIAAHVGSDELREIALRCAEHATSITRALDQLDQLVTRLRRR